jgi:hypothetical protein
MGSALARADVIASGLLFPEGTIFVSGDLYFVDYFTSNVLRLDGSTVRKLSHLDGCGANGLLHLDGSLLSNQARSFVSRSTGKSRTRSNRTTRAGPSTRRTT